MTTTWTSSERSTGVRARPIARSSVSESRLLERDDEEEQPGHERHDEAVEQEDDLERLAGPGRRRAPCVAASSRVSASRSALDGR